MSDDLFGSLAEALRWAESAGATGSFRVEAGQGATFFTDAGRLYFAAIDGTSMSGSELDEAGIDRAHWKSASQRPGARVNFVDELIHVGCPREAIERFLSARLATAIETVTMEAGPVVYAKGRHGFGATIGFLPSHMMGTPEPDGRRRAISDDALVSLTAVAPAASVPLSGALWNALSELVTPARYVELVDALGPERAAMLVDELAERDLIAVVQPHGADDDPWTLEDERRITISDPAPPAPSTLFTSAEDDEDDEYVPDKVGRQAYAAMANMRAAARTEPPPQEKARALRRLIEAVRGL